MPLSGPAGGSYTGDFTVTLPDCDLRCEAKARAAGFGTFYSLLENHDTLVVEADRNPPLVIVSLA